MKKRAPIIALFAFIFLIIAACSLPGLREPVEVNPDQLATAAQQTAEVLQTQSAFATLVAQATGLAQGTPISTAAPTLPGGQPTATGGQPTITAFPTLTPFPTLTQFVPSITAVPTLTPVRNPTAPPTVTPVPLPCNRAEFVTDVTVPDRTKFWPNEVFSKVWRLKNTGSCTWNSDYQVIFTGGQGMNTPESAKIGTSVDPGETLDLVLNLKAPGETGNYIGYWQLRSSGGATFGIGASGTGAFTTNIDVVKRPSQGSDVAFNFTNNFCAAAWSSPQASGMYCPSSLIYRLLAPKLEGGYQDDEPALVTIPTGGEDGEVKGRFPLFSVQAGDRFTAVIGCLDASSKCSVRFHLEYREDGSSTVKNLGSWTEESDGDWRQLNVALADLAGKKVQFILRVNNLNDNNTDDRAFWLQPRIVRSTATSGLSVNVTVSGSATLGSTLTYSYVITNTGTTQLTAVSVADNRFGNVALNRTMLNAGQTATGSVTQVVTQANIDAGSLSNTATATATKPGGGTLTATDTETISFTRTPGINLVKTASTGSYNSVGQVISYTLVATNSGNTTLTNVSINDPQLGALTCAPAQPATLAPGAALSCTGSHNVTQANIDAGSYVNNATASGTAASQTYTSAASASVGATRTPGVSLVITPAPLTFNAEGDVILFTIVATNTGNVTLSDVSIAADAILGALTCTPSQPASLAPGAALTCTASYTITAADVTATSLTANASVSAASSGGAASANASATINRP